MSMTSPDRVELTEDQRAQLKRLVRAGLTAQALAGRARIVLLAAGGLSSAAIAARAGVVRGHGG